MRKLIAALALIVGALIVVQLTVNYLQHRAVNRVRPSEPYAPPAAVSPQRLSPQNFDQPKRSAQR